MQICEESFCEPRLTCETCLRPDVWFVLRFAGWSEPPLGGSPMLITYTGE